MSSNLSFAELHKQLEQLEDRVKAMSERIAASVALASLHQQLTDIRAKSAALKQKLQSVDESKWDESKSALEADWQSLSQVFGVWLSKVDKEFTHKPKAD